MRRAPRTRTAWPPAPAASAASRAPPDTMLAAACASATSASRGACGPACSPCPVPTNGMRHATAIAAVTPARRDTPTATGSPEMGARPISRCRRAAVAAGSCAPARRRSARTAEGSIRAPTLRWHGSHAVRDELRQHDERSEQLRWLQQRVPRGGQRHGDVQRQHLRSRLQRGYHRCGGVCVNNTSVATCGAACSPCPAPPNGTATCNGNSCGVNCSTNFADCDGLTWNGSSLISRCPRAATVAGRFAPARRPSASTPEGSSIAPALAAAPLPRSAG